MENKSRNSCYIVVSRYIPHLRSITSSKDQIFIIISSCHLFINWFDTHARRASWWPHIKNYSGVIFQNRLEVLHWDYMANFSEFWYLSFWGSLTTKSSHTTELLHEVLHHCGIHTSKTTREIWHARGHLWHSTSSISLTTTSACSWAHNTLSWLRSFEWILLFSSLFIEYRIALDLKSILLRLHHRSESST